MSGPPNYLIKVCIEESERLDLDRVRRLIEYLGGVATDAGFAFYSNECRSEAMKILSSEYGREYFVIVDSLQDPTL